MRFSAAVLLLSMIFGCGRINFGPSDGGSDAGPVDASPADADASPTDADASPSDGAVDAIRPDSAPEDGSVVDATPDAAPDSGMPSTYRFLNATLVGGTGNDRCFSLGMNSFGVHAITGKFNGTLDLGEGPVASMGDDMFLVVYEPDGRVRRARRYGTGATEGGNDVDVDEEGGVYVAGEFRGNVDLGGGPLPNAGGIDLFVGAFGPTGAHRWSQAGGSAGGELGHASAFDGAGGGALTGYATGPATFGTTTTSHGGGADAVVARYAADGSFRWATSLGGTGNEESRGVVIDRAGRVIIAGFFESSLDIGMGPVTADGRDGFVAAFDPTGAPLWLTTLTGPGTEQLLGIAGGDADLLYVVGSHEAGATFGGRAVPTTVGVDGFAASLDEGGRVRWVAGAGGTGAQVLHGVAVRSGRAFVTGYFDGSFEMGPLAVSAVSGRDSAWVALAIVDGSPIFGTHIIGATALGIGASGAGLVAVSGYFSGSVDFGTGPMMEAGNGDVFVARYGVP